MQPGAAQHRGRPGLLGDQQQALRTQGEIDHEQLLVCDLEFHALLGQSCHNLPLETVYRFVMQYFKPYIADSHRKRSDPYQEPVESHEKILQAIERRDASSIEQAVEYSMEVWENLILGQEA